MLEAIYVFWIKNGLNLSSFRKKKFETLFFQQYLVSDSIKNR